MDLKSRGQRGKSYIQRAIRRVEYGISKSPDTTVADNLADAELTKKVEALFTHEPLFERLHTEPKWRKAYASSVKGAKQTAHYIKKQKPRAKAFAVIAFAIGVGLIYRVSKGGDLAATKKTNITKVAGANTSETSGAISKEKPSFGILTPKGRTFDDLETAKISPEGNDPVYAFTDAIDGVEVQVSQQEVPKSFDYNKEVELERVAKDFQATNIIQIDDMKVYHGYSEKLKNQSLVFIKKDRLIFIKSTSKLTDDQWTGYILSLQ